VAGTSRRPEETTLSPLYYQHVADLKVRELVREAMADSPLGPDEYAVYSLIFEIGPVSATTLAHEAGMPLTTALDLVLALQARGHVLKERNPRDGRAMLVRLTPDGVAAQREAMRYFTQADQRLQGALAGSGVALSRAFLDLADAAEAALEQLRAERAIDAG
jgi:DNA-binding MarR family transcriptional regulator